MTVREQPRVIERITFSDDTRISEQHVIMDASGTIDYEFYYARARESRSEAFADFFRPLVEMVKGALAFNLADHSRTAECGPHATGEC